jgi:hypothetical protein
VPVRAACARVAASGQRDFLKQGFKILRHQVARHQATRKIFFW